MQEPSVNETATSEVEAATDETATIEAAHEGAKMSKGGILSALRGAVASGAITSKQAAQMRGELGVHQSTFTRKSFNRTKARAADKRAKQARKATRGSLRGQKNGGGK